VMSTLLQPQKEISANACHSTYVTITISGIINLIQIYAYGAENPA